jgi:hypothetical protein
MQRDREIAELSIQLSRWTKAFLQAGGFNRKEVQAEVAGVGRLKHSLSCSGNG